MNINKQEINLFRMLCESATELVARRSCNDLTKKEMEALPKEGWLTLNKEIAEWTGDQDYATDSFLSNFTILEYLIAKYTKVLYDIEIQQGLKQEMSPLSIEEQLCEEDTEDDAL